MRIRSRKSVRMPTVATSRSPSYTIDAVMLTGTASPFAMRTSRRVCSRRPTPPYDVERSIRMMPFAPPLS
jgi:hypothetical protein